MKEINVTSSTQQINVKSPENTVTVVDAGPVGPPGPQGLQGPIGPQGPAGIHVGTIPPEENNVLWYDTN